MAVLLYKTGTPGVGTSMGAEEILAEVGVGLGQVEGRLSSDERERKGALGRRTV